MKILLVNYEYKGQGGGAGQQLYYMARAFRNLGHEVSLLIGWDYAFGEPEILDGITTHVIKYKRKNIQLSTAFGLLSFSIKGCLFINKLTRKFNYDVIQFYFSVPTGILKFGIHGKVPYVVSLRGMDIPGLQKNRYKGLSSITANLNRNITKNAAIVISNSNESASAYHKFSPNIAITVIPNSINFNSVQVKASYSNKISNIVSVGRLVSWKRHDLLIEAVAILHEKHPQIKLNIYGKGYQEEYLQKLIIDKKAEKFISLKGFVDRKFFSNNLHEYDLFAFMSTGDSCPNTIIEAMASGLPVVAAKAGGTIDLVLEGITGVFTTPNSLDDTVQQLEWCINNSEIMANHGINGRQRVEDMYSTKKAAERHIELYKEYCDGKRL